MRIALVVDSPKRDLDGVLLIAYHLVKSGAEALVVPMYQQGYDLPLLAPDGVLVNYARENNRELLDAYRALGIRIMVMDTEGGVLSESGLDSPQNWASEMRRTGLAFLVHDYFFWGSRLHRAFIEGSGIPAERLHLTGCPRYDFCVDPWRRLLTFPEHGYVLVNTNFSAINPRFTKGKEFEKAIFVQLGWPKHYVDSLFRDLETVFPRYVEAIERLAKTRSSVRVRLRPHPFENEHTYVERFAALPNVIVDGSGNVLPVIANAACTIHLNCGTAVESLMLGTPTVSLEFLNTETMRSHAALPSKVSVAASSQDELTDMIDSPAALRARQTDSRSRLLAEFIEPWFWRLDGDAAQRVASKAFAVIGEHGAARPSLGASVRGGRSKTAGRLLAGTLSQLLGSQAVDRLQAARAPARRAKTLDVTEIRRSMDMLCRVDGTTPNISVTHARHPLTGVAMASLRLAAS